MFQKTVSITLTSEGHFVIETQDPVHGMGSLQIAIDSADLLDRLSKLGMLPGYGIKEDVSTEGVDRFVQAQREALRALPAEAAFGPVDKAILAFRDSGAESATFYADDLEINLDSQGDVITVVINNLANDEPPSHEDMKAGVLEDLGALVGDIQRIEQDPARWVKLIVGHASARKTEIDMVIPYEPQDGALEDADPDVSKVVQLGRRRTDGPTEH